MLLTNKCISVYQDVLIMEVMIWKQGSAFAIDIGLDQIALKLSVVWTADRTAVAMLDDVVATQDGLERIVNFFPVIHVVTNMGNARTELASVLKAGTDGIVLYPDVKMVAPDMDNVP